MSTSSLKRYHDDEGNVHPELKDTVAKNLGQAVHGLYTWWVRANYHRRDFQEALAHTASLILIEWMMGNRPSLVGCDYQLPAVTLAPVPRKPVEGPAVRFYDELCSLNPDVDISRHWAAIAPHFLAFGSAGFAPRDFILLVHDVAMTVAYDHDLSLALHGLGGNQGSEAFLTNPYGG